ncbi:MAG: hypothetical protein HZA91_12995 [Verrucomicrobia bacterium]|nr:hypothetical protein [Verrucomicrobiota bacterium]
MTGSWRFVAAGVASLVMAGGAHAATTNALARAVTFSGQIHVFCADQTLASALAAFCEDVREKLAKRVGDQGPWRAPVAVVVRQRPEGSPVRMPGESGRLRSSVATVSGFLRFQIDMEAPPPVDTDEFVRMLAGVLLSEMASRSLGKVAPGQPLARVPAWFVWGMVNRMSEGTREGTLREAKRAVEQGTLPTYAEFTESDGPQGDVALHRACCELLVQALETQLDGREKIRQFVFGLKPGRSWQATMCEVFGGGFGYKPGLEKWWALFASRASGMIVPQTQSWTETRRRLEEALRADDAELAAGLSTGDLPADFVKRFAKEQDKLADLLLPVQMRLLTVAPLAHPVYRPAITAYLDAIGAVRRKKLEKKGFWTDVESWFAEVAGAREKEVRRFQAGLQRAVAERHRAERSGEAITSYVGSVEASFHPEDFAGRFTNWFQANPPGRDAAQRPSTPVGDYLDKVESGLDR